MFQKNITGVETTFGFNLLKAYGAQQGYVFSPLTMLFALSLIRKDKFHLKIQEEYQNLGFKDQEIEYYLDQKLDDIIVRSDTGMDNKRNYNQTRIMFNGAWESTLNGFVFNEFHAGRTKAKPTMFLTKLRDRFLLNVDDVFKIIILPFENYNLKFFIIIPVKRFGLRRALTKLTKERFDSLVQDSEMELVNVVIPQFDILNLLVNAKNMGIQLPIKVNLEYKQRPRVAGLLYRPENREPYHFHADHPFVFGVLRSSKPVFLGVYK